MPGRALTPEAADADGRCRAGGPAAAAGPGQSGHLLFKRSGNLYVTVLTGPRSKVHDPVYVWLPPQYRQPAYATTRFPVIELFSGYPGTPSTWLTRDVPDAITHNFRAVSAPQRWGLMGYSTGGFCAAKLALQYPHLYGAAVSLSGYFTPSSPLIVRSAKLRQEDSPLDLIRRKHRLPVALLLAASSPPISG